MTYSYDFSQLSHIWQNICDSNGVSVDPYANPQQQKVLKPLIYV